MLIPLSRLERVFARKAVGFTLCDWRVKEKQVFGQVERDERYLEGIIL